MLKAFGPEESIFAKKRLLLLLFELVSPTVAQLGHYIHIELCVSDRKEVPNPRKRPIAFVSEHLCYYEDPPLSAVQATVTNVNAFYWRNLSDRVLEASAHATILYVSRDQHKYVTYSLLIT